MVKYNDQINFVLPKRLPSDLKHGTSIRMLKILTAEAQMCWGKNHLIDFIILCTQILFFTMSGQNRKKEQVYYDM